MPSLMTDQEIEDEFDAINGCRCKHCGQTLEAEDADDMLSHLLDCIGYAKYKRPQDFESAKRYDLSIQADKTYPGKLVVQGGTEDEMVQGIKEVLKTHSIERHHTRLNIWNHEIAEELETVS